MGFVYVIEARAIHAFKVGIAKDTAKRLSNLRQATAVPLTLRGEWLAKHPRETEHRIHRQLERFRIRGEWFTWFGLGVCEREIEKLKGEGEIHPALTIKRAIDLLWSTEHGVWWDATSDLSTKEIGFRTRVRSSGSLYHFPRLVEAWEFLVRAAETDPVTVRDEIEARGFRWADQYDWSYLVERPHSTVECSNPHLCPGRQVWGRGVDLAPPPRKASKPPARRSRRGVPA